MSSLLSTSTNHRLSEARVLPRRVDVYRVVLCLLVLTCPRLARAEEPSADFDQHVRPLLQRYCGDCHSGDEAEAGLDVLQARSAQDVQAHRDSWKKVFSFVKIQAMPPADAEQPTEDERHRLLEWLDHTLFDVDCEHQPDPGRVTVRRLNRSEYNNTIRDLVGIDFQPADDFPSDDVGYGFDNIGDVLSISPLLMEKYLDAAEQIATRAIQAPEDVRIHEQRTAKDLKRKGAAHDGPENSVIMVSAGAVTGKFDVPQSGRYMIRIEAGADQAGDELAKMRVTFDDREIATHEIKEHQQPGWYESTIEATAGRHRVSASFINDFYNPKLEGRKDRNLYVRMIELNGPLDVKEENLPAFQRQYVVHRPGEDREGKPLSVTEAAALNIQPFLARAFRRPVNSAEVSNFTRFVRLATDREDSFERGMQIALEAILVAPEFLFRIEQDEDEQGPGTQALDQFELASRLSYFLWSSTPDDELLQLAGEGRLSEEDVITRQVDRMLDDPRSAALIENFAGQWLGLRTLHTAEISPDKERYPQWNDQLRHDIERETLLFFGSIVHENRSVLDLLGARYTFVNGRLAELYGLPGVEGDEFRKVELTDDRRGGLLTQPSILVLTSYPDRTSPVRRGNWVLTNILGDEPPPPPPTTPPLDETRTANPNASIREQMELHRADPNCASCHVVMDQIGFGLENFDAIGRWRDRDGEHPVESVGKLPTGETFSGPAELIDILSRRKDEFVRCLSEKLLTYALGRGLEYYDRCAIDRIVSVTASDEYRFKTLAKAVATSRPFLLRTSEMPEESE